MKVFCRKALVLCAGYALLLVLTMLNLLDYKWHKEPLQQCNPDGPLSAAAGAAGGSWGRPGPPPAVAPRAHTSLDLRTCYRPSAAAIGAAPAAVGGMTGVAAPPGNGTSGTRGVGDKRQLVYVFTTWHSGSSFFGELFNQNPEVFFLYEPVWHVWQKLYPGDTVSLQGGSAGHAECSLYSPADSGGPNLTTLGIFGAATNKVVCSSPLCPAYRKEVVGLVDDRLCKKCLPQRLAHFEEECHKYRTLVIKGVHSSMWWCWCHCYKTRPWTSRSSTWCVILVGWRAHASTRRHGLIRESLQVVHS
ncbi:Carbohydrate sulfotransferase 2 [Saguinus oedipus]|uniref:Carbohydrate sulfotransferase 2 n=1 Tax=Saguinus oedipus TaxID=9490 RepID=A0ABQ9VF13_SAGOE|nr:Carbohydrate sulfotransferase 2 [Saguinus oedipus]